MKRKILFVWGFCALFSAGGLRGDYAVILPEKPDKQELLAAKELVSPLREATGEKVCVFRENALPAAGKKIFLGKTRFAAKQKIDPGRFAPEESFGKVCGNSLILTGGRTRGIVYGVLDFLEKELGVIFCDETYTHIPSRKNYHWKKDLAWKTVPAFPVRGIYSYFAKDNPARQKFFLRNRLNMFDDEGRTPILDEWGIARVFGSPKFCHTFYYYTKDLPKEKEAILSLSRDGKRIRSKNGSGPGQVCQSNPATRAHFLRKLEGYIKSDREKYKDLSPRYYVIDMNDNLNKCVCTPCMAIAKKYGSYAGLTLEFTNHIAREIRKKYKDIHLLMSAYSFNSQAPKGIRAEKNVIVRLAQLGAEWGDNSKRDTMRSLLHKNNTNALQRFQAWSRITSSLAVWDYWILYDGKSNYPSLNVKAIAENARLYKQLGVKSMFAECESSDIASFHPLRLYIGAKTMYDPAIDADKAVMDFMDAYYGKSAPEMKAWYGCLEKRMADFPGKIGGTPIFARKDLDGSFYAAAEKLLGKAIGKVEEKDPVMNYRIRRERVAVDFSHLARQSYLQKMVPEQKVIADRLLKDYTFACDPFIVNPGRIPSRLQWMKAYIRSFSVTAPLPETFKNKQVIGDFLYSRIQSKNGNKAQFTADEEAAAKGCIRIQGLARDDKLHFGVYDRSGKRHLKKFAIRETFKDGKYHFYSTGRFTLTEKCFLWADWSWNIQTDFSEYYDKSGQNNNVEAFISIKSTGKGPHGVFAVDRVILVRLPR